ncbi:DEAD/DEAH box helicase [Hymenobacter busanensis]|uniref:DEAD/DEAH box helicase n=2 Tax=Hymenobacter busanensis TaxID=2607656 RepID=A0A7L5A1U1_9BACT|nr:DEAD/DEAH box helicase [Hymenobacter busanensis]KAA9327273.1 DEAD/DEAH box helicase [Hymenobacter busanensis]QHJ09789.1 DEAD/DEAH box helicase [Hymenobacter busanensis]
MGYTKPSPIQEQAIPSALQGKDLIACAQTGTGKTAAYLLPILDHIAYDRPAHTVALVLCPTRELAKQIDEQVEGFGYYAGASSIAIYGGGKSENWEQQKRALTQGADIIVATPGRLIAHMQLGYVKLDQIDYLVLDEADKMLDMGFSDDILQIVAQLPTQRQTLLFSATMPNKIRDFSKKILHEPDEIRLAVSKPAENINQQLYMVYDTMKIALLEHLIGQLDVQSMILFTSRKMNVGPIERALRKKGFNARGITSDRTQEEREQVLREFKNKQFQILVATDVMSRGIDVSELSHVVNFDLPRDAEDYVHRIGRTARAGADGMAITFVSDHDQDAVVKIEKLIEKELVKNPTPEEIGPSPEFDPKKYRGRPHGHGGKPTGRGARSPYAASASSERSHDPNRPVRPAQPRPAAPVAEGETAPEAISAEGQEAKRRKKRRSGRGPKPEGSAATSAVDAALPAGETTGSVAAEGGEGSTGEAAKRRRKRGGRNRGGRAAQAEGSAVVAEAPASAGE